MGGASSKAARQFPKTPKSAWAGARTPSRGEAQPPPFPRASETKNEAIEWDSMDPQLMANLNRLGPVKVDHHMQTVRPAAGSTHHMLQARLQSEVEARSSRPTHNHLLASSLFDLLEERKTVTSQRELEELAKNYDMDISKLVGLARCVNSPSVAEGSVVRTVDRNGVESITMTAAWVDPVLRGHKSLLGSGR